MKPKCKGIKDGKICGSEQLDEGTDGKILCHKCGAIMVLMAAWQEPSTIKN